MRGALGVDVETAPVALVIVPVDELLCPWTNAPKSVETSTTLSRMIEMKRETERQHRHAAKPPKGMGLLVHAPRAKAATRKARGPVRKGRDGSYVMKCDTALLGVALDRETSDRICMYVFN